MSGIADGSREQGGREGGGHGERSSSFMEDGMGFMKGGMEGGREGGMGLSSVHGV